MTNRTWIGGGNNEASNPKDWSPTGAPQAGDTLVMNGETNNPINVSDYNLRGNSLNVQGGANTINMSNAAGTIEQISSIGPDDNISDTCINVSWHSKFNATAAPEPVANGGLLTSR